MRATPLSAARAPILPLLVALAGMLCALSADARETTVRSFAIPGHGSLELEVPLRWREDVGWTPGDHRPSIRLEPDSGADFVMTVTVLPPPADAPEDFGTAAWLRRVVEDSARRSLGLPEGSALQLEEIGAGGTLGWYYSVTDTALPDPPPSGTFRVMTQGASKAGPLVLTSTILTQQRWGRALDEALRMLATARVSDRPADSWRIPGGSVQARGGLGERYDLPVPEGFETLSRQPLALRDRETGASLTITATATDARRRVRDELRRLEADLELRSPGAWRVRRQGPTLLAGEPVARLVAVDELRDEEITVLALPLADAVLELTWRVHPTRAREAEGRLKLLLDAFTLKPSGA